MCAWHVVLLFVFILDISNVPYFCICYFVCAVGSGCVIFVIFLYKMATNRVKCDHLYEKQPSPRILYLRNTNLKY